MGDTTMRRRAAFAAFCVAAACQSAAAAPPAGPGESEAPKKGVCFALYTVHGGTLKLTAQFYPLFDFEPFDARLEVDRGAGWEAAAEADIAYPGYAATFRVDGWDDRQQARYRVVHAGRPIYSGVVRANPRGKREFVMAALSCNSPRASDGGDLSKRDIVSNLRSIDPDLVFFAGDQVYDHSRHLEHWLQFGRDFGDVLRNRPSVCLPDDHDVGQANIWGESGKRCPSRDGMQGGYYMPVAYIQEVERAQTSHLPDPVDPEPVLRGIGVYFTQLTWGGVSFAILEDRKFKSAPARFNRRPGGRADSINEADYNPRDFDSPQAVLLGERQLRFLEQWVVDWRDAKMKCVLSQSPFAQMCNYSGSREKELRADFDSNGWPQSGRDRAVRVIRKGFACHVAGDQHLGGVLQHGLETWRDGPYSFATPAIANLWPRWWDPTKPGANRAPGAPSYTGDHLDGFGNRMTVHAAANPTEATQPAGEARLTTRAAGFGVVRFDKAARTTTFECWPRNVDVTDPGARQYPGWPVAFSQLENHSPAEKPLLPTLRLAAPDQVVRVVRDATGETVSCLRVPGRSYQPHTPEPGAYSVAIGEGPQLQWVRSLASRPGNADSLDLSPAAASNR